MLYCSFTISSFFCYLFNNGYTPRELSRIIPFISFSTFPIGSFALIYVLWKTVGSWKAKNYFLLTYGMIVIMYYLFLYLFLEETVIVADFGVNEIYDDWINPLSGLFYIILLIIVLNTIFGIKGLSRFKKMVSESIEKKVRQLIIIIPLISIGIFVDMLILGSLIELREPQLWIFRLILLIGIILLHHAFKLDKLKN